jgi:hypothetical protein
VSKSLSIIARKRRSSSFLISALMASLMMVAP